LATTRWWLDGVLGQGVEFDVFGQSCYAPDGDRHPGYQGTPAEWATTFAALVDEYPDLDFVIAEYSAEQRAANDVMFQLPNGRGLGTFNWDPTRFYETHPNVPLFTTDGEWNDFVTIPERIGLYDQMAQDYGLRPRSDLIFSRPCPRSASAPAGQHRPARPLRPRAGSVVRDRHREGLVLLGAGEQRR